MKNLEAPRTNSYVGYCLTLSKLKYDCRICTGVLQCFGYHPDYKLHDARFWQHRI